jgi:hypothetical protein
VRHHQNRDAGVPICAAHDVHDLDPGLAVQVARRFISQQDGGLIDQRPRQCDALLLAARKFCRFMAQPLGQANGLQQVLRTTTALGRRYAGKEHGELYILRRGHGRNQVERLKDEADACAPVGCQVIFVECAQLLPRYRNLTG